MSFLERNRARPSNMRIAYKIRFAREAILAGSGSPQRRPRALFTEPRSPSGWRARWRFSDGVSVSRHSARLTFPILKHGGQERSAHARLFSLPAKSGLIQEERSFRNGKRGTAGNGGKRRRGGEAVTQSRYREPTAFRWRWLLSLGRRRRSPRDDGDGDGRTSGLLPRRVHGRVTIARSCPAPRREARSPPPPIPATRRRRRPPSSAVTPSPSAHSH